MSLKSGKRKLLPEGRRSGGKESERVRIERSTEKGTDRGRSAERSSGSVAGDGARPSVFSRLGTKIQGQSNSTQQPTRPSGSGPGWGRTGSPASPKRKEELKKVKTADKPKVAKREAPQLNFEGLDQDDQVPLETLERKRELLQRELAKQIEEEKNKLKRQRSSSSSSSSSTSSTSSSSSSSSSTSSSSDSPRLKKKIKDLKLKVKKKKLKRDSSSSSLDAKTKKQKSRLLRKLRKEGKLKKKASGKAKKERSTMAKEVKESPGKSKAAEVMPQPPAVDINRPRINLIKPGGQERDKFGFYIAALPPQPPKEEKARSRSNSRRKSRSSDRKDRRRSLDRDRGRTSRMGSTPPPRRGGSRDRKGRDRSPLTSRRSPARRSPVSGKRSPLKLGGRDRSPIKISRSPLGRDSQKGSSRDRERKDDGDRDRRDVDTGPRSERERLLDLASGRTDRDRRDIDRRDRLGPKDLGIKKDDSKDGRKGSVGRREDERKADLSRREERSGNDRGFGRSGGVGGDREERGRKDDRRGGGGSDDRRDDRGRHELDGDRRRRGDDRPLMGMGERRRDDVGPSGDRRRDDLLEKKRDEDKGRGGGRDRDWEEDNRRSGGGKAGRRGFGVGGGGEETRGKGAAGRFERGRRGEWDDGMRTGGNRYMDDDKDMNERRLGERKLGRGGNEDGIDLKDLADRRPGWNRDNSPRRQRGGRGRRGRGERRGNRSLGGGGDNEGWRAGRDDSATRLEAPFGRGRQLSVEKGGSDMGGQDIHSATGRRSLSRPTSGGGEKNGEPVEEGIGDSTTGGQSRPESRTENNKVEELAADPRRPETDQPIAAELAESAVSKERVTVTKPGASESMAESPEPTPCERSRKQSAGSVKDDTGEDLAAEDFSDIGDSDEDILNQEEEKDSLSRPVSRISGKSSRSAKDEAEAVLGGNKKEEQQEEESEASKANAKLADSLGADWGQLMGSSEAAVGRPEAVEARKRWSGPEIIRRIGISKRFLGEEAYNRFLDNINKNLPDDEKVVLLDPVPALHMHKLRQQEEERNLFTDFGPHCRALSARADLRIRRRLNGLPAEETGMPTMGHLDPRIGEQAFARVKKVLERIATASSVVV